MVVYAPYPLGETRVQREAEALLKRGYAVDVICVRLKGEAARDEYKGVQIYREKYRMPDAFVKMGPLGEKFFQYLRFFVAAGLRLTRLHLRRPYGSVQVHNLPDFLVFCALFPRLLGVPVILDLHDLMPEFFAGRFGQTNTLAARLIRLQERWACRFASHVITVSELWRQALIRRGVPEEKVSVVMNVADASIFYPRETAIGAPAVKGSFRLIYHGTFAQRNGLDLAIQAVAQMRSEIPGIQLRLVGAGDYLPEMQRMIVELGVAENVTIEGLVLAEQLPDILLTCHLGLAPLHSNPFTDTGLPTKLMEYAALGMPAIASRTSANVAYFSEANCEFFEPGSADDLARCIRELYQHPARLAELARGCQNFNRRYNWAKISDEYVDLVTALQQGRRSAGMRAAEAEIKARS